MELSIGQKKSLSEFINTIAAAWFTAGIISPVFIKQENEIRAIILGVITLVISAGCVWVSLTLTKEAKI